MRNRPSERITDNSRRSSGTRRTIHNRETSAEHQRQHSPEADGGGGGDRQQSGPGSNQSETTGQTQRPGGSISSWFERLTHRIHQLLDNGPVAQAKRRKKLKKIKKNIEKAHRLRRRKLWWRTAAINEKPHVPDPKSPYWWDGLAKADRLVKLLERQIPSERAEQERTYEQAKDRALLIAERRINEPDFRALLASEGFTEEQIRGLSGLHGKGSQAAAHRRQHLRTARTQLSEAEQQYTEAVRENPSETPQREQMISKRERLRQTLNKKERLVKLLERGLVDYPQQQEAEAFNTKRDTALLAAAAHLSDPVIHETHDAVTPIGELERYRRNQDRVNYLAGERQSRQRRLDNPAEAGLSQFGVANVQAERDQIAREEEMLNRERHDMEADHYRRGIDIRDRTYAALRLRLAASDIPSPVPAIREPTQPRFQGRINPSLQGILADMRQSQDPNRAVEHLRQRGYYQTPDQRDAERTEIERNLADMRRLEGHLPARIRAQAELLSNPTDASEQTIQHVQWRMNLFQRTLDNLPRSMREVEDTPHIRSQEAAMTVLASMPTLFSRNIEYWLTPQEDRR